LTSLVLPIPDWADVESQTIPLRRIWQMLSLFESVEYGMRMITSQAQRAGAVGFRAREENGLELAACVKHARGYFEAAETASVAVSPLLLFYGVSSLAKAVVVARSPQYGLFNMEPYHGLSASRIAHKNVGKKGLSRELMAFEATVAPSGTFVEYAETLSGAVVYRVNDLTAKRPTTLKISTLAASSLPGMKVLLGDLLARQPSIRSIYYQATGNRPLNHYGVTTADFSAGASQLLASFANDPPDKDLEAHIRTHFPQLTRGQCITSPPGSVNGMNGESLSFSTTAPVPMFPLSSDLGMRSSTSLVAGYFVAPFGPGVLSEALQLYALSYLLGMLVRYYPTTWMQLIAGGKGDEAFALCRSAADMLRERFPVLALEGLTSYAHERTFTTF